MACRTYYLWELKLLFSAQCVVNCSNDYNHIHFPLPNSCISLVSDILFDGRVAPSSVLDVVQLLLQVLQPLRVRFLLQDLRLVLLDHFFELEPAQRRRGSVARRVCQRGSLDFTLTRRRKNRLRNRVHRCHNSITCPTRVEQMSRRNDKRRMEKLLPSSGFSQTFTLIRYFL